MKNLYFASILALFVGAILLFKYLLNQSGIPVGYTDVAIVTTICFYAVFMTLSILIGLFFFVLPKNTSLQLLNYGAGKSFLWGTINGISKTYLFVWTIWCLPFIDVLFGFGLFYQISHNGGFIMFFESYVLSVQALRGFLFLEVTATIGTSFARNLRYISGILIDGRIARNEYGKLIAEEMKMEWSFDKQTPDD